MTKPDIRPPICDYEGSNYRTEFWESKGRNYEDQVERIALRRLLPKHGRRFSGQEKSTSRPMVVFRP